MKRIPVKKLLLAVVALGLLALLVRAFMPATVEVDLAPVQCGLLRVTVDHEGKTRIRDRYTVAAPLAGRLRRIELRAGDLVRGGQTLLAVIDPNEPSLLDARDRKEAKLNVKKAEEAKQLAEENLKRARADLELARRLVAGKSISPDELEQAEHKERRAVFLAHIADFELKLAEAALTRTEPNSPGELDAWRLPILSPIDGSVLEVMQESEKVVSAGAELLKLGDTANLECVIDVLSADGVRIRHAMKRGQVKVLLEHWGGEQPLWGRVRRVEPGGFTKISALGVEEQRVNVIVDFTEPYEKWKALGDHYRVEARIIIWEGENVLKAPSGALFRHDGGWAVFVSQDGRAVLRPVRVGQNNGLEAEVLAGLQEGEQVVVHPSDRVQDGVGITPRQGR